MKALPVSEAKMKLSGLIDTVNATDEEIVITKNGRPAAVLISPEEFEGLKETVAVRSDLALMKEINKEVRGQACYIAIAPPRLTLPPLQYKLRAWSAARKGSQRNFFEIHPELVRDRGRSVSLECIESGIVLCYPIGYI